MIEPVRYPLIELTAEQVRARLAEIGHPLSEEEFELAWVAASYAVGLRSGNREGIGAAVRALVGVVTTPAAEDDGGRPLLEALVPTRWPYPEARFRQRGAVKRGWSIGKRTVARLGLTVGELDRLWAEAKLRGGSRPKLPLGLVCAFFPPPVLAALAAVIRVGAIETQQLLERYLLVKSLSPAASGERRGKPLSQETLRQYEYDFRSLMLVLHKQMYPTFRFLHEERTAPPTSILAGWYVLPPPLDHKVFKAPRAKTDRTAPDHLLLRRALARARRRLLGHRRRGLRRWTEALALEFFAELGGRLAAVARISKDDLIAYYPAYDGPAVRLRPGKGYAASAESVKPIRQELYDLAQEYLAWTGLNELPSRMIWISGWGPGGIGDPLPAANENAVSQLLARTIKRALGDKPPHTIRHASSQYAAAATRAHVDGYRDSDPRLGRISEQVGARALLDQAFDKLDELGYGDLEADREKFSRIAHDGICRALFSDDGLRRAPDWHRIERARSQRDAARVGLDAATRRFRELEERRRTLELRDNGPGDTDEDSEGFAVDGRGEADIAAHLVVLADEVRRLRRELRDERRRRHDLTVVVHECEEALEARTGSEKTLAATEAEVEAAGESSVHVPDSLSDDEYEALLQGPPHLQPTEEPAAVPHLRRLWVTPKELARASGRTEATVRNYMTGRRPCPWWDARDVKRIVHGRGRVRAIAVFEMDPKRVSPIMWERLLAMCAEPPPPWYANFTLPPRPQEAAGSAANDAGPGRESDAGESLAA